MHAGPEGPFGPRARVQTGHVNWQEFESAAPELAGTWFGYAYLNDVSCFGADSIVAAGYWSGVRSDDRAETYRLADLELGGFGVPAQIAAVEVRLSSTASQLAKSLSGA